MYAPTSTFYSIRNVIRNIYIIYNLYTSFPIDLILPFAPPTVYLYVIEPDDHPLRAFRSFSGLDTVRDYGRISIIYLHKILRLSTVYYIDFNYVLLYYYIKLRYIFVILFVVNKFNFCYFCS
jgi:hypothetical protein